MSVRSRTILAVFVFGALSAVALGQASSIGPATVPPSMQSPGLVQSPNPLDTSGNLVITGNIRGGRYFRGVVPYSANSYFSSPLGSTSLDSFVRDSASLGTVRSPGVSVPFFSQSQTATRMELGRRNVVSSPTPGVGLRIDDRYVSPRLSGQQTQVPEDLSMLSSDGTLSTFGLRTPQAGVATETAQTGNGVEAALERLTDPLRSVRLRQFRGEVSQEELLREDIRESLLPAENLPTSGETERLLEELKQVPLETAQPEQSSLWQEQLRRARRQERDTTDSVNTAEGSDAYESLKPRYRDVLRREKPSETSWRRQEESDRDLQDSLGRERDATPQEILEAIRSGQEISRAERSDRAYAGQEARTQGAVLDQIRQTLDGMGEGGGVYVWSGGSKDGRGQTSYRERARAIMGPYQSLESYTEAKFREHMIAGEVYLEQGKYYRAASAYNMALVYEPDDVSALVGRSHALFAAGEYMSSALFLSRALEALGTEDQEVSAAEQLGVWGERLSLIDRDKLDSRLVDLEKWQKENDSPELRFLAGYVYYQTGRNIEAKKAMAEAARRMPGAEAVITLKNVVDSQ